MANGFWYPRTPRRLRSGRHRARAPTRGPIMHEHGRVLGAESFVCDLTVRQVNNIQDPLQVAVQGAPPELTILEIDLLALVSVDEKAFEFLGGRDAGMDHRSGFVLRILDEFVHSLLKGLWLDARLS